jgi:enamine deaminase RidA (YjgF/YER057c/UK114 family)
MNPALIRRNSVEEFQTLRPNSDDPIHSLLEQLGALVLTDALPQVLELRYFGSLDTFESTLDGLKDLPGSGEWPVSFLDGAPSPNGGAAGIQLHTVRGAQVETIRLGDTIVGRAFQDEGARYCILGGVGPDDLSAPMAKQAEATLLRMEAALQTQGMELKNLVRTWFFLDDILGWYGAFNETRTRIFRERGMFEGYVPASTGIGGVNHRGAAVLASALAMEPTARDVGVTEIPSPLQCPAGSYGSSFSRAAELAGPGFRRVLVSGTASIDPQGRTTHVGSAADQMALTVDVVEAILRSRGMGLQDVSRGNAYFKNACHAVAFGPALQELGVPSERLLISSNTVCRDELLFEMEVEAVLVELEG